MIALCVTDWTWGACIAYATRSTGSSTAAREFAEWAHKSDEHWRNGEHVDTAWDRFVSSCVRCPECASEVWDRAHGHHLHRCWNTEAHGHRVTLAFDTPLA